MEAAALLAVAARIRLLRVAFNEAEGTASLTELGAAADPTLPAWLAREGEESGTLDLRTQAALLLGSIAFPVALLHATVAIGQRMLLQLPPVTLHLRPQREAHEHLGVVEWSTRHHVHLDLRSVRSGTFSDAAPSALAGLMVTAMAPIVVQLTQLSRLGEHALWRQVADMVASAFLHAGRDLDEEAFARAFAVDLLATPASPLANGRTGFQKIVLHQTDRPVERWFLRRGGCCRWYTCAKGELCAVCVLRKPRERRALLQDLLARELASSDP
jgi:hypothetical protein